MKKWIWLGLILFLAGCAYQRKEGRGTFQRRSDEKALPSFEIKEEIHNFGILQAGEIVVYTFEYRNKGYGKLEVTGAESGCSCLTVEPEKKVVMPGDSGKVRVVFNTSGLYGKQLQSFRVFSSQEGIRMDLAITAEVVNDNIDVKQQ